MELCEVFDFETLRLWDFEVSWAVEHLSFETCGCLVFWAVFLLLLGNWGALGLSHFWSMGPFGAYTFGQPYVCTLRRWIFGIFNSLDFGTSGLLGLESFQFEDVWT